jgi:ATP-dependent protease ClpP protease subunit
VPAAAKTLKLDPARLVEVIGPIDGSAVGYAQKIDNLSRKSKAPIFMLLNSPGGSIMFGYTVIDAIHAAQARGVKIVCATGVLAASMAFNMLLECNEAYSLKYAKLLFHPVKSQGVFGQQEAEMSGDEMKEMDQRIIDRVGEVTGMTDSIVRKHYFRETLREAYILAQASSYNWLTLVDAIDGSENVFTYQKPSLGLFFGKGSSPAPAEDPLSKSRK